MGAKQSKRSVDISGKEADGAGEVAVAGAGGEGRMEALADADALKPQINGDAHIHEENTDKEKQLEIGTPENEKDATTEKENKEHDNEKEKEATPVTNGDPEPKENGETTPAPEDGKKPKNEKVKKKWSLRSISFSRKDKPKQDKKQKEEPKTNGEPEKVPEEASDVTTPETVKETLEEVKSEIESKDEKTPETPVTEPLTNGTSTPETPKVESPAAEEPLPTPAKEEPKPEAKVEPEPEQLPVNGLSLEEPKSESTEISHIEESKSAEPIPSTETAPVPESPVKKEVCVVALSVDTPPPPLPANPPPSAVASFAVSTMALDVDASLFKNNESPSIISLATSDQIVEPQALALEHNNENTQPISPLKVAMNEENENTSITQKDLVEPALITSSQTEIKPVDVNPNMDLIKELINTSEIAVDKTETVLESELDDKVVLEESAIVGNLVAEVMLAEKTVSNESEIKIQQEKILDSDVSRNDTTLDNVAESTEMINMQKSIDNTKNMINESVVEPIADIEILSDNISLSDNVTEIISEERVLKVDDSASFVAVNKDEEQTIEVTPDNSGENNKNSCKIIAESIIDRVAEEVANIIVDDVSVKSISLDNIPSPGHHTDGNEVNASEKGDVDKASGEFIPPLPEPCEIPLPEPTLIESLDESVEDLPPPPPPIEDDMLPVTVENETKDSIYKSDLIKEATDIIVGLTEKVHINGLEENIINGNGTIENENIDNSTDLLGSAKCNGDGKLDTSDAPGQLLQEPLSVSDKIADLIPEIPVVPDLTTETEISTDVAVVDN